MNDMIASAEVVRSRYLKAALGSYGGFDFSELCAEGCWESGAQVISVADPGAFLSITILYDN